MFIRGVLLALSCAAILPAQPPTANYDESKVPSYTLPDVLGKAHDAKSWNARRAEIVEIYRKEVFGRDPGRPAKMSFDATAASPALDGKALRKIVTISFGSGPKMHMLMYLPAAAKKPSPVVLGLAFGGIHLVANDPGVPLGDQWARDPGTREMVKRPAPESSRGRSASQWQVEKILDHGYGLAVIDYNEIEPDFDGGMKYGVRPVFFKPGQTAPAADEWGAIGAWAWGLSRAMDYLETDKSVDAKHVAVFGHSRLGKTALWAGGQDQRFALVISNESGEGGAAISRRDFGERTKDLNTRFPHWFCANFRKYNDREDEMPFDSHMLLALSAPRPLYVASAEGDQWSDPRGEFLGAVAASRAYELLGKKGIGTDQMPGNHQPIQHDVAYHIRAGKHDVTAYDWDQYLKFMEMHWGR
jgi:hypothetical protein